MSETTIQLKNHVQVANRLEGIEEYFFSKKLQQIAAMNRAGDAVINLGIGSPDLPPHSDVISVLQNEAINPQNHCYQSYRGSEVLRNEIAKWYQKWYQVQLNPSSEILPLMGSKEGIMHICMTYLNPGDEVLVPNPGYPTYLSAAKIAGADLRTYSLTEENNYHPDLEKLERSDLAKVKMMFVNYPHMPTGASGSQKLFERIVAFGHRNRILIVHDNPYSFLFSENENQPISMLSISGAKEIVIELNSLSKSHNMAGWRIGFLSAGAERINEILRFKTNMDSGMFLPLQLAAAKALSLPDEWYVSLNEIYFSRRKKMEELLQLLGCEFRSNQQGMFVWASLPEGFTNSYEYSDFILETYKVFITPGALFGSEGNGFIRASLCMDVDKIEEALERIKTIKR